MARHSVPDNRPAETEMVGKMELQSTDIEAGLGDVTNQAASMDHDSTPEGVGLDSYGLPLIPQPSSWRDDPLVSVYPP
jgi:hypothetical protein